MEQTNNKAERDKGYNALLNDIKALYKEALAEEFHDWRNVKYPAPKVELVQQLNVLIHNVKNGKYDN